MSRFKLKIKRMLRKVQKYSAIIGVKDAKDEAGRFIKIQGRGASIILHNIDETYIISSESVGPPPGFVLYQLSIKNWWNESSAISDVKRKDILTNYKSLLERAGYQVQIMN